jgi:hypothetical protein
VDGEAHEEVAEVDHPCEVVGEEQGVVDEVDSVIVEVDEVVLEEDSFPEAVDTRLRIHVQYRLDTCADSILIGADVAQHHDRPASVVRCGSLSGGQEYNIDWLRALNQYADSHSSSPHDSKANRLRCNTSAGPPRSGQLKHASECNPPSFSTRSRSTPAPLAALAKSRPGP